MAIKITHNVIFHRHPIFISYFLQFIAIGQLSN